MVPESRIGECPRPIERAEVIEEPEEEEDDIDDCLED